MKGDSEYTDAEWAEIQRDTDRPDASITAPVYFHAPAPKKYTLADVEAAHAAGYQAAVTEHVDGYDAVSFTDWLRTHKEEEG